MASPKTTPSRDISTSKSKPAEKKFVLSFEAERFYKGMRYHWMVCLEEDPTQLISWGHAPTMQQAETAGNLEITDLMAGISKGGQIVSTIKPFGRRR